MVHTDLVSAAILYYLEHSPDQLTFEVVERPATLCVGRRVTRCHAPTIAHWKTGTAPAKLPVSNSRRPGSAMVRGWPGSTSRTWPTTRSPTRKSGWNWLDSSSGPWTCPCEASCMIAFMCNRLICCCYCLFWWLGQISVSPVGKD